MSGNVFIDTNILVYLNLDDQLHKIKRNQSIALLNALESENITISVQVLNEFYNVLVRHGIDDTLIQKKSRELITALKVLSITEETLYHCWSIRKRFRYSYYDSLIIASAIEGGCHTLYSEDLQHGQKIGRSLIISNPYIKN